MSQMPPMQQLVSFRCLDSYLDEQRKSRENYTTLFEKKQKMIGLVQQKKIGANQYKALLVRKYKETNNSDVKSLLEMDLLELKEMHNGNVDAWFEDCINTTGDQFEDQTGIYQKHLKSAAKVEQPQRQVQTQKKQSKPEHPSQKQQQNTVFNPDQVINFRGLDNFMDKYQKNKPIFDKLFEKKRKMLDYVKQKKITAEIYKGLLERKLLEIQNIDIKSLVEMDLSDLSDVNQGNTKEWFEDLINDTQDSFEGQEAIFKGIKPKKQQDVSNQKEIDFSSIVQEKIEPVKKQSQISQSNSKESQEIKGQFLSFKVLDGLLDEHKQNQKQFFSLFERKKQMIESIGSLKLNGEIYKSKLLRAIQTTKNDDFKFDFQMELANIDDINEGDVKDWFEDLVNESGDFYQAQMAIYSAYKNPLKKDKSSIADPHSNIRSSIQIRVEQRIEPENEHYPINEINCLTAISDLMKKYRDADKEYYIALQVKKNRLLELVNQNQLTPENYPGFLKKTLAKVKSPYLQSVMKQELLSLQDDFAGNSEAWFLYLLKQIKGAAQNSKSSEKSAKRNSIPISRIKNEFNYTDTQLLEADPKIKIEYLLRQLAKYQSVLVFFKNNDLKDETYNFAKIYYFPVKNEVMAFKEQFEKQDYQKLKVLNVVEFNKKNIKPIDFQRFHAGADRNDYIKDLAEKIKIIEGTLKQYKQYLKNLKKATNPKNIDQTKKKMISAQEDIIYLKSIAEKQLVVPPKIEQEKLQKYNLDLNDMDPNEMEITVYRVDGLPGDDILKIFLCDSGKEKWEGKVHNGNQTIKFKTKIPSNKMEEIIKGSEERCLQFKIYEKGWFGSKSMWGEGAIAPSFVKSNAMEDKVELKNGTAVIHFVAKVHKPKRPIITSINDYKMTKFPEYQHQANIETEFIKKNMVYVNPTASEIR